MSVVDVGKLSKPITKLVEVVAQGIGTVYKPIGTVIQAKADAKAKLILAEADIKESELWQRAASRVVYIEVERQRNLDAIVGKAYTALPEHVSDEPVPKDWITNFFISAQDVSDEDMQLIWGRILAGEVAQPGSTSRRTLEFLKTMARNEAEMFAALLSVSFKGEEDWFYLTTEDTTFRILGHLYPRTDVFRHMMDIGILQTEAHLIGASKTTGMRFSYGGVAYRFIGPPTPPPFPGVKSALEPMFLVYWFTVIGQELSKVAQYDTHGDFVASLSSDIEKHLNVRIEKEDNREQQPAPEKSSS